MIQSIREILFFCALVFDLFFVFVHVIVLFLFILSKIIKEEFTRTREPSLFVIMDKMQSVESNILTLIDIPVLAELVIEDRCCKSDINAIRIRI